MSQRKKGIQQLTAANTVMAERIKHVEEEYEVETDDECDSEIDLSLPEAEAKLTYNKKIVCRRKFKIKNVTNGNV